MANSQEKVKEPSRGVAFFDRYSPVKFITTDDDREYKQGDDVYVGTASEVYGPYRLDMEIGRGNGKIHWKAFSTSSNSRSMKPKTKAELEQEAAQKDAELEKLRKQLAEATK